MNREIIGNLTTIIKILIMTFAPALAVYIGVTPDTIVTFLTACLTFALAVLDAKYPNTILPKTPTIDSSEPILNDEYILPDEEEEDVE